MGQTTWTLDLRDRASAPSKRMSRELRDLALALKGVEASAERAERSLMRMGRASSASAQRETQAARETARANREVAASIRERERAEGRASRRRTANNGGPTRVDGMFSQREAARLRAMGDANQRRFARDRARRERDQARVDAAGQRAQEQRNIRYFQSVSRAQQRSFRETAQHNRALNLRMQRDQRRVERENARGEREQNRRTQAWARDRVRANSEAARTERSNWSERITAMATGATFALSFGRAALDAARWIADLARSFAELAASVAGSVVQMISFRESTLNTLAIVARDAQGNQLRGLAARQMANEQFRFAQQLAQETPLEVSDVIGYQRRVSGAGIYGRENRDLVLAAADVGSFNTDPGSSENFIRQMAQMHGSSRLQMQDYGAAADAAGVGRNDVLRRAAQNAGITRRQNENDAAYQRRVQAAQRSGRITGRHGYNAMLDLLRERSPTGQLGGVARSSSGTLTGALSNFAAIPRDLILGIEGIENSSGVKQMTLALNQVTRSLSGASKQGQRLRLIILGLVNDTGKLLTAFTGKGGKGEAPFDRIFGRGMDEALAFAATVREALGGLWEGFSENGLASLREMLAIYRDLSSDGVLLRDVSREWGAFLGAELRGMVEAMRELVLLSREFALSMTRGGGPGEIIDRTLNGPDAPTDRSTLDLIRDWTIGGVPLAVWNSMNAPDGGLLGGVGSELAGGGAERAIASGARSMVSNKSQTNNTTINITGVEGAAQAGGEVEQAMERVLTRHASTG